MSTTLQEAPSVDSPFYSADALQQIPGGLYRSPYAEESGLRIAPRCSAITGNLAALAIEHLGLPPLDIPADYHRASEEDYDRIDAPFITEPDSAKVIGKVEREAELPSLSAVNNWIGDNRRSLTLPPKPSNRYLPDYYAPIDRLDTVSLPIQLLPRPKPAPPMIKRLREALDRHVSAVQDVSAKVLRRPNNLAANLVTDSYSLLLRLRHGKPKPQHTWELHGPSGTITITEESLSAREPSLSQEKVSPLSRVVDGLFVGAAVCVAYGNDFLSAAGALFTGPIRKRGIIRTLSVLALPFVAPVESLVRQVGYYTDTRHPWPQSNAFHTEQDVRTPRPKPIVLSATGQEPISIGGERQPGLGTGADPTPGIDDRAEEVRRDMDRLAKILTSLLAGTPLDIAAVRPTTPPEAIPRSDPDKEAPLSDPLLPDNELGCVSSGFRTEYDPAAGPKTRVIPIQPPAQTPTAVPSRGETKPAPLRTLPPLDPEWVEWEHANRDKIGPMPTPEHEVILKRSDGLLFYGAGGDHYNMVEQGVIDAYIHGLPLQTAAASQRISESEQFKMAAAVEEAVRILEQEMPAEMVKARQILQQRSQWLQAGAPKARGQNNLWNYVEQLPQHLRQHGLQHQRNLTLEYILTEAMFSRWPRAESVENVAHAARRAIQALPLIANLGKKPEGHPVTGRA